VLLVLLGAPGAGKGTQADVLAEKVGVAHVSSGDLLRKHRADKTELGTQAQSYMDKGDLVPDDLVIKMVLGRLAEETDGAGVVLDGFPRTEPQAVALDAALEGKGIDRVLYVKVPEDELVRRLGGRYNCRSCQRPFPEETAGSGKCPVCGGELYQRDDDRPEAVMNRLKVYEEQTSPLISYYKNQGKLDEINGLHSVEEVTSDLLKSLEALAT
jgi:adenylate kinase